MTAYVAVCAHCNKYSLWHQKLMVYPVGGMAPIPNPDLPDDIKTDYEEARSIVSLSPRGAAALLRLAIQKLCKHLGEKGRNIDDDIASLVKKGLHPDVQKAWDIVRVVGNHAVHPGQIDLNDNPETAEKLFGLVNLVTFEMITRPREIASLYDSLPDRDKAHIVERDSRP
jgi:hypothetical protein